MTNSVHFSKIPYMVKAVGFLNKNNAILWLDCFHFTQGAWKDSISSVPYQLDGAKRQVMCSGIQAEML